MCSYLGQIKCMLCQSAVLQPILPAGMICATDSSLHGNAKVAAGIIAVGTPICLQTRLAEMLSECAWEAPQAVSKQDHPP